jgi:hypothetical protein
MSGMYFIKRKQIINKVKTKEELYNFSYWYFLST